MEVSVLPLHSVNPRSQTSKHTTLPFIEYADLMLVSCSIVDRKDVRIMPVECVLERD